jgi:hypothetical protein
MGQGKLLEIVSGNGHYFFLPLKVSLSKTKVKSHLSTELWMNLIMVRSVHMKGS